MTEYYNAPNYSAPADPLAGFHGPTSKGREGRGGKGDARGGDGREEKGGSGGRKGGGCPVFPWADMSTLSTTHALVGWCSDAFG